MDYLVSVIIGYILGSIPTAYLVVKKKSNIDLTEHGSKNIGALNSYEVSQSKFIGIIVLVFDLLKGLFSALIVKIIFGESFELPMLALISAVFAHCYSPWLKFKGGRGLATAAGGALIISPIVLLLWVVIWLVSFAFRKHIHFSNTVATILTGALAFSSVDVLNKVSWMTSTQAITNFNYSIMIGLMMIIILSRHISPMMEYLKSQKQNIRGAENE